MMKWLRGFPRISVRLLAFNILLVFLPAGGVLVLDTYEAHLLEAQERTMGQEGRLLAAALETAGKLEIEHARKILVQLGQRHLARLRVVGSDGHLLADSAALGPRREEQQAAQTSTPSTQDNPLYKIGSWPFRLLRRPVTENPGQVRDIYDTGEPYRGQELDDAFAGRYGASTRITPGAEPVVTLFIAIPIRIDGQVEGAVLVSQSTSRILSVLYAVRLDVFKVFLLSLGAAVILSLVMATTIARPLTRLRKRSEAILDRRGGTRTPFEPSQRLDEIGDLERALADLARRLDDHLEYTESFAADFAHEVKNPLASIRTAADVARDEESVEQRQRFLDMIQRDVARVERLLSGAREISRIDVELEEEDREDVILDELVSRLADGFRLRLEGRGPRIVLAISDRDLVVSASVDRLTQVFENLLENAISFSPPEGSIVLSLKSVKGFALATVADEGPGVPEAHRHRLFSRFFSYRPDSPADENHIGLGLAVVKTITEAYGGSVSVHNHASGGTVFTISLPLAR